MIEAPVATRTETITVEGEHFLDKVKELIHEGNVQRIVIKQDKHVVVEFPLTVGVIGAVLAPPLAVIGAAAALLSNCTVEVEREVTVVPDDQDDVATGTTEIG
jgi:hypothetical protein